jgi:UDP-N-acetylglucosamine acyltransferase
MNKFKNILIGLNNKIAKNTIQGSNIKIGNNNIIYPGVKIYENTQIGDNNIILSGNILGEYPIHSSCKFDDLKKNGLIIGNNNFLHINNVIFSGHDNKTIIGNNNKLLGELHVGHDVEIYNFVNIYPRTIISGYVKLLNYSGIGISTSIHQNITIGDYSFIGMNNTITKNVFPFYININNNLHRLNKKRIEENFDYNYLLNNENNLKELSKMNNINNALKYVDDNFKDNNIVNNILKNYYSIIKMK